MAMLDLCSDMADYKMTSVPKGICLIINNSNFHKDKTNPASVQLEDRHGTDQDKEALKTTFYRLGFIVECHNNASSKRMKDVMSSIARKNHSVYDCFVCCVLSHGDLGQVYGSDGVPVDIKQLTFSVKPKSCHSLTGKPKVFIIQACQGDQTQYGYPAVVEDSAAVKQKLIPSESDMVLAYSTVPGFVSYRNTVTGSVFIQELTQCINGLQQPTNFLDILTMVNNAVSSLVMEIGGQEVCKQVPSPCFTLRKRLLFGPKTANTGVCRSTVQPATRNPAEMGGTSYGNLHMSLSANREPAETGLTAHGNLQRTAPVFRSPAETGVMNYGNLQRTTPVFSSPAETGSTTCTNITSVLQPLCNIPTEATTYTTIPRTPPTQSIPAETGAASFPSSPMSRCILIIGKKSNGKSTLGNIILGEATFGENALSPQAAEASFGSFNVKVVDTPSVYRLGLARYETELLRWRALTTPGPDAVLFTVRCDGRCTAEECQVCKDINSMWEKPVTDRLIIAFTFGDKQTTDISRILHSATPELKSVLHLAGKRYLVFSKYASHEEQRKKLHALIDNMLSSSTQNTWNFGQVPHPTSGEIRAVVSPPQQLVPNSICILIIGPTGSGKSTVGNILLGEDRFGVRAAIDTVTARVRAHGQPPKGNMYNIIQGERSSGPRSVMAPVTGTAVKATAMIGQILTVVDTPGLTSQGLWQDYDREFRLWKTLTSPGPDAILFTIRHDCSVTGEEFAVYQQVKCAWGDHFVNRLIVAFTFGDKLFKGPTTQELLAVMRDAKNRHVVFNKFEPQHKQREQLFELMEFK